MRYKCEVYDKFIEFKNKVENNLERVSRPFDQIEEVNN